MGHSPAHCQMPDLYNGPLVTPRYTHAEDGNCRICRNAKHSSSLYAARPLKPIQRTERLPLWKKRKKKLYKVQKGVEDVTYKLLCEHRLKETEEEKSFVLYELVDEIYKENCEYKFIMEQSTENINNSRQVSEISNIVTQNQKKKLVSHACNCNYYYFHHYRHQILN